MSNEVWRDDSQLSQPCKIFSDHQNTMDVFYLSFNTFFFTHRNKSVTNM